MKESNMRFGEYIKAKRLKDSRELTLKDVSEELGISLSMLSDIEQGRRKPFEAEKIEKFAEFFKLTADDLALMYDLAAKEHRDIPADIEDVMMYSETGDIARRALRMTQDGIIDEEDWKEFIRKAEQKKEQKQ